MPADTLSQRRLASAVISLKKLQDSGLTVLRTSALSRDDREALVEAGFLKAVIKGWYMPSRPEERDGETTAWYASANDFIARVRVHAPLPRRQRADGQVRDERDDGFGRVSGVGHRELGRRSDYMSAPEEASSRQNIVPFAKFVASRMRREAELAKAKRRAAKGSASTNRRKP